MKNRENEIEKVIISNLKKMYGIQDDKGLLEYTIFRSYISQGKEHKCISEVCHFIISELCISSDRFKDVFINYLSGFENSIYNIIESICKIQNIDFNGLNKIWLDIYKASITKCKIYLKFPEYEYYLKKCRLSLLRDIYKSDNNPEIPYIVEFEQDNLGFQLTLEEQCNIHIYEAEKKGTIVTEAQLEKYLIGNLEKIEKGLRLITHQYVLEEGRIDILARDIKDNMVVIELKIREDKNLLWQLAYYKTSLAEKYNSDKIRVISLCPSYSQHMLMALQQLSGIELMTYKLDITNREIKNIYIYKNNI